MIPYIIYSNSLTELSTYPIYNMVRLLNVDKNNPFEMPSLSRINDTRNSGGTNSSAYSIFNRVKDLVRNKGLLELWHGGNNIVIRQTIFTTVSLTSYEVLFLYINAFKVFITLITYLQPLLSI